VHYTRAPIVEAVIDVQFDFAELPAFARLEKCARALRDTFPQAQQINAVSVALVAPSADGDVSSNASSKSLGIRLTSIKGDRILQLRRKGFSYSHMQPYSEWETFVAEMKPYFRSFLQECEPTSISRAAVRYINRIIIPQGVNLDDYLNFSPRLIGDVSEEIQGYFMQAVLPQKDLGTDWTAIVNSGLEATADPKTMAILLDIDIFCTPKIPAGDSQFWEILSKLRDRKNKIFESAITDKVRSIIE